MSNIKAIKSSFAIVDVTAGTAELTKHFEARPITGECPEELRIPITLTGYLDYAWGDHDGTSQQFVMQVEKAVINAGN